MLVPTCNLKPLLGFGSIEHRARRFCETIPRTRTGPSRKPDSALSRHPSPGPEAPGPLGAAPTSPARGVSLPGHFGLLAPVVYLAGPSQDTAGGLLPHPFTHHLCRKMTSGHRLVCSLLHLTWRRACTIAAPRVLNPSGLCYESGLCSVPWEIPGYSDGSDGPDPVRIIP